MQAKKRLGYIDISRGIAAILVILGHLVQFNEFTWRCIFSYHMPFFFLISGVCTSKRTAEQKFFPFLGHLSVNFLVPTLFIRLFQFLTMDKVNSTSLVEYVINPRVAWFVTALFFARIVLYVYCRLERHLTERSHKYLFAAMTIAGLLFTARWMGQSGLHLKPAWCPIQIDSALIGSAFCIIGFYLKQVDFVEFTHKLTKKQVLLSVLGIVIGFWFVNNGTYINVCDNALGRSDLFYVVFASVLSFFTIVLSVYLFDVLQGAKRMKRLAKGLGSTLELIGRNSLFFYIGHAVLFHILTKHLVAVTGQNISPMYRFTPGLVVLYTVISLLVLTPLAFLKEQLYRLPDKLKRVKLHKQWITAVGCVLCVCAILLTCGSALRILPGEDSEMFGPRVIDSVEDFVQFRNEVNKGKSFKGQRVVQTVDLDLSEIENFVPIGIYDSGAYFEGTYDGGGHVIRNLRIVRKDNCGLFGMLGGTVKNLGIESGYVEGACVGAIAGHASGTDALISNCYSKATVKGSIRAGGIADNFGGTILSCWSDAEVTAKGGKTGGIVAYSAGELIACYSFGMEPYNQSFKGEAEHVAMLSHNTTDVEAVTERMNHEMSAVHILERKLYWTATEGRMELTQKTDWLGCISGTAKGLVHVYSYETLIVVLIVGTWVYGKIDSKKKKKTEGSVEPGMEQG